MVTGAVLIGVFVVGLLGWAIVAPLDSAVIAPGVVRVEENRKIIRHREGGIVRAILVREGQKVKKDQVLLTMDDVQPRAAADVMQNQVDTYAAQVARFEAEASGARQIAFPAELTARISDPRVGALIRDQEFLFASRLQFFDSQAEVLRQRTQQIDSQMAGVRAQIVALDENVALTRQELEGYQTLYAQGYAPRTLILRYQRALADLAGRRGALTAEQQRLAQQKGEAQVQLAALSDQRISQSAEGLRQMQAALADARPKLASALQTLAGATVRAPVDGYVLNLTQSTVGGVVGQGELLMAVVPSDAPLAVTARIKPDEIEGISAGMKARVTITAFSTRRVSPFDAVVTNVSADELTDEKSGQSYYRADLKIDPKELTKLPRGETVTPGMPAQVMITTGRRTVMGYIIGPLTDTVNASLRDK
ncbi:MAG: HlyD family type I secretion periplasmic adaptor subunit [Phenylobacterium sp.]|nr:HlyD family type I secretion periplasmic adaptor subunit [Phenylobacterium sp.]MCA3745746.1 HlyD family type I secretion periplasmic adaptor subunit [Phenylobacterium sp.]MCA4915556.1 HlyD family type I secretion periplasmic adaptor subunit [Phenylobacterium sp.]MCA6284694.1 HlyD family type I secretion periplasmic adaptor subunit [Phenylobacterium sp.]